MLSMLFFNGCHCLELGFNRLNTKSGRSVQPSILISLLYHCVIALYGFVNGVNPGYGDIWCQILLNRTIRLWCSRNGITQSIRCFKMARYMVWSMCGTKRLTQSSELSAQKTASVCWMPQMSNYWWAASLVDRAISVSVAVINFRK